MIDLTKVQHHSPKKSEQLAGIDKRHNTLYDNALESITIEREINENLRKDIKSLNNIRHIESNSRRTEIDRLRRMNDQLIDELCLINKNNVFTKTVNQNQNVVKSTSIVIDCKESLRIHRVNNPTSLCTETHLLLQSKQGVFRVASSELSELDSRFDCDLTTDVLTTMFQSLLENYLRNPNGV